jgi:hypothetical protein
MKKLKEANRLYKKKIADEIEADRQRKAEERKKEKETKGKKLAEACAQRQRDCNAATLQKSRDTASKGKQAASHSQNSNAAKWRCVVGGESSGPLTLLPPELLPRTTTRGQQINLPQKYIYSTICAQASVYYNTVKPGDNSYCTWLRSLIFSNLLKWLDGSSGDVDHWRHHLNTVPVGITRREHQYQLNQE